MQTIDGVKYYKQQCVYLNGGYTARTSGLPSGVTITSNSYQLFTFEFDNDLEDFEATVKVTFYTQNTFNYQPDAVHHISDNMVFSSTTPKADPMNEKEIKQYCIELDETKPTTKPA